MSNQAPCIRMVLFRVWTEGGRQQKTPGAETPGALVREAGLEPARPEWTLEPESSESANSTTRALFSAVSRLLQYSTTRGVDRQALFSAFFRFWLLPLAVLMVNISNR